MEFILYCLYTCLQLQWHTMMTVKLVSSSTNSELSMPETPRRFTWRHFHSGGGETQQRDKGPHTNTPIQPRFCQDFKSESAEFGQVRKRQSCLALVTAGSFLWGVFSWWFHRYGKKTAGRRTKERQRSQRIRTKTANRCKAICKSCLWQHEITHHIIFWLQRSQKCASQGWIRFQVAVVASLGFLTLGAAQDRKTAVKQCVRFQRSNHWT